MIVILTALVQWVHVAAAMLWVGGGVLLDVVLIGPLGRAPIERRRLIGDFLAPIATRFFAVTGGLTILFGLVRGTVLGPVTTLDALDSGYGVVWLASLLLTIAIAILGGRFLGPAFRRMQSDAALWKSGPDGGPTGELEAALRKIRRFARAQSVGFALVLAGMVMMGLGVV